MLKDMVFCLGDKYGKKLMDIARKEKMLQKLHLKESLKKQQKQHI